MFAQEGAIALLVHLCQLNVHQGGTPITKETKNWQIVSYVTKGSIVTNMGSLHRKGIVVKGFTVQRDKIQVGLVILGE